eukprot:Rhum_TRINITY_DN13759_c1_g1::Rhum_TRINITY_DN13759_c1_g1_i1::g.64052::m.64052
MMEDSFNSGVEALPPPRRASSPIDARHVEEVHVPSPASCSPCGSSGTVSPRALDALALQITCEREVEELRREIEHHQILNEGLLREERSLDSALAKRKELLGVWTEQLEACRRSVEVEKRQREHVRQSAALQRERRAAEERRFEEEKEEWEQKRAEWGRTLASLEEGFANTRASDASEADQVQSDLRQIKLQRANSQLSSPRSAKHIQRELDEANDALEQCRRQQRESEIIIAGLRNALDAAPAPAPAAASSAEAAAAAEGEVAALRETVRALEAKAQMDDVILKQFRSELGSTPREQEAAAAEKAALVEQRDRLRAANGALEAEAAAAREAAEKAAAALEEVGADKATLERELERQAEAAQGLLGEKTRLAEELEAALKQGGGGGGGGDSAELEEAREQAELL